MIKSVYVFENGMASVFDENGEQVPELQGKWLDLRRHIIDTTNSKTLFYIHPETLPRLKDDVYDKKN